MGQWEPITEAARVLDCSTDTIRRRIKARTLECKKEDGRWLVFVGTPDDGSPGAYADEDMPVQEPSDLICTLEGGMRELQRQLAQAAADYGAMVIRLEAERDDARAQAAWLRERVEVLEVALAQERESRTEERRRTDSLLMAAMPRLEDAQAVRPWWRRLMGRG